MPIRFDLTYSGEDEAKRDRPVMIHRAILGSVERMFAILLEHYKGKWPFWISPRQAIVCPVTEKLQPYALQVTMSELLKMHANMHTCTTLFHEYFAAKLLCAGILGTAVFNSLSHSYTLSSLFAPFLHNIACG